MNDFKARPKGNFAVLIIVWLILAGAVAAVTAICLTQEGSVLNYIVILMPPVFFVVPACMTTYSTAVSLVEVRGGTVRCVYVAGMKKVVLEISLADVEAVWGYRRTVAQGNRLQITTGCAFRRHDGYRLFLDMAMYTVKQRDDLLDAVCAACEGVERLSEVPDKGRVYRVNPIVEWEAPEGAEGSERSATRNDASAEGVTVTKEGDAITLTQEGESVTVVKEGDTVRITQSAAETPNGEAATAPATTNPAVLYHYRVYEKEEGTRCSLCGARIASATAPGDHQTAGYQSHNGRKWICRDCWDRFAADYHWVAVD